MFDHDGLEEVEKERFNVPISELNLPSLISVEETKTLLEIYEILSTNKFGAIVLTNNSKLSGILTERDFLTKVWGKFDNWREVPASEVMTKEPKCLKLNNPISECIKFVSKKRVRHLPIIDDQGKPIHMVSIKDLLGYIVQFFPKTVTDYGSLTEWEYLQVEDYGEDFSFFSSDEQKFSGNIFKTALKRVLDNPPIRIDINSDVQTMISAMQKEKVGTALIMEYDTELRGIITERDILFKIIKDYESEDKNQLKTLAEYMTPHPHQLLYKHYLAYAINNMFQFHYRNIIVVDEDHVPLGVVSLLDIFSYIEGYMQL